MLTCLEQGEKRRLGKVSTRVLHYLAALQIFWKYCVNQAIADAKLHFKTHAQKTTKNGRFFKLKEYLKIIHVFLPTHSKLAVLAAVEPPLEKYSRKSAIPNIMRPEDCALNL